MLIAVQRPPYESEPPLVTFRRWDSCPIAAASVHALRLDRLPDDGRQPRHCALYHWSCKLDDDPPFLLLLRVSPCSMAAEVRWVWPIQQAVTDFGAQRQRLKEVRQRLGWRILGCDLIECFEE